MDATKKSCRARLEQDSSVTGVTASAGLVNGGGLVAIQGQRKLQAIRLLAKQGENGGIAPLGQNHIGVFPLDQSRKSKRGRLACLVEFPAPPIHFDLKSGAAAMRGICARWSGEPNLHDLEWWHFIVESPFIIAAFDGLDFSLVVRFDSDVRQREDSFLPAVKRRHHEVAVVELQARVAFVDPASPAHKIGGTKNGNFEDGAWRIEPQIRAFSEARSQFWDLVLSRIMQLDKSFVVPRNVKRRRETIGQTVVRLVPVDQPQRHPLTVRVEVENPSLP